jgi:hypothetical protein
VKVKSCMVYLIQTRFFKRCKTPKIASNFHEFWSEKLHYEKPKKKTICLMDSVE